MARRFSTWRFLRSRRLAVWLIIGLAGYTAAATAVPRDVDAASLPRVVRVLGLAHPFSNPAFLALTGLLALSTALCAWERSRAALARARSLGRVTEGGLRRLRGTTPLPLPPGSEPQATLASAEDALRGLRLKTRRGPKLLEATGGRAGLLGSPLFHWSLAALFVVIAAGQLTRAEGQMGIPVGGFRDDVAESYGTLEQGPLSPGHSGLRIGATDFTTAYTDDTGVDRGPSPVITLSRDGRRLVSQRVYPNKPLRYGSLMIHSTDGYGLSAWIAVQKDDGEPIDQAQTISDFDVSSKTGTIPARMSMQLDTVTVQLQVSPMAEGRVSGGKRYLVRDVPADPAVQVIVGDAAPVVLRPGETTPLAEGYRVRLDKVTAYARISIADDWSVSWIYALFAAAAIGLVLAVFVPFRSVRVLLAEDGRAVHVELAHARHDVVFEERVRSAIGRIAEDAPAADAPAEDGRGNDALADGAPGEAATAPPGSDKEAVS